MDRETQIIKYLEDNTQNAVECLCSKKRIKFWLKVLKNDFQRTYILDMARVQHAIVDYFQPFEDALTEYVMFRDTEELAHANLWAYYELIGNKTAPEVRHLNALKKRVRETYKQLLRHVDKTVASVSNGTQRNRKKKISRS